jgi:hypothetical protein
MKAIFATSASALNLTFSTLIGAEPPAATEHAVPGTPPAQGVPQTGGPASGAGVSGHGAAPHEILFKKVDTDRNGTISSAEFRIAVTTGVIPQAGVGAGAPQKPEAAKSGGREEAGRNEAKKSGGQTIQR